MLLLLTAAAWAVLRVRDERPPRTELELHENLLPRFREAELVRTTTQLAPGSQRGRVYAVAPDLRRGAEATGLLAFPDGDPPYAWCVGRRNGFVLDVLRPRDRRLSIRLGDAIQRGEPQRVRVLFNGRQLCDEPLATGGESTLLLLDVPARSQRRGRNHVEFVFAWTEMRELQGIPVPLPLAAIITNVGFRADDEAPGDMERPDSFALTRLESDAEGEARSGVVVPPGTAARLGLRLRAQPPPVLRLVLDRLRTPLEVSLQLGAGERAILAQLDRDTLTNPRVDLDLSPWAGRDVVLELWSHDGPGANVVRGVQLRAAGAPAGAPSTPPPPAPARRPSFLLVVLDALAASRVGAYGAVDANLTPRLDALAARGVMIERATAPASYTLASVGALLTGQPPREHGVVHLRDAAGYQRLADGAPRLAGTLSGAGWRTAAWITNPNAGAVHGYGVGFDEYAELYTDPALWDDGVEGVHLAPRLAEFLAETGDDPYLAYVHVFEPHAPYEAPADLLAAHVEPYDGPARGDRAWLDAFKRGETRLDADGWRHLRQLYAARVALADRVLGELLDALEASGRADDTLVVVTSDHGEAFGEHGWLEHGDYVFAEQVDVPLVLAGPGLEPRVLPGPATLHDIAPTLLRRAGVSVPDGMSGRDLLAPADPQRALAARSAASLPVLSWTRWPWRLHVDTATRGVRLHDLSRDPGERIDLSPVEPATALLLQQELTRAHFDAARSASAARVEASDPERLAQLEELGYTGEAPEGVAEPGAPAGDGDDLPAYVRELLGMLRRL